jgi:5-(carboxyamino)imidazole ribonucleotide mutase
MSFLTSGGSVVFLDCPRPAQLCVYGIGLFSSVSNARDWLPAKIFEETAVSAGGFAGNFNVTEINHEKAGVLMAAQVGVIMGSKSDWATMSEACKVLDELEIPYEKKVVSAHRTPDLMFRYAEEAEGRGIRVIIAGAGGAAHLPGMVASKTVLPVIGVPVQSKSLNGLDSLLSIVQMPGGIPVATVAIGTAGAVNAGLLAAQILGASDADIRARVQARRDRIRDEVLESGDSL